MVAASSCAASSTGVAGTTGAAATPTSAPAVTSVVDPNRTTAPAPANGPSTTTTSPHDPSTTATTAAGGHGTCGWRTSAPAHDEHVIWVWMENKNASQLRDAKQAPFFAQLASTCGSAANYVDHGVHPSLPNYIAATSGSTQGIADDNSPAAHPVQADNIFRQVRARGGTARSYEESMSSACQLSGAGRYAVKHNPAAYFVGGDDRTACATDNVPFTAFATDLSSGALPSFSMVTPDLCNDMHDCSVATGDAWLAHFVTEVTASADYQVGSTVVLVVFDESEGAGTMPFFVVAPSVQPGTRPTGELDHAALLAFTEDALGISEHLGAAAGAASLRTAFGI